MNVLLDTNFLVYCAKQKIDYKEIIPTIITQKHEIVVPRQVVEELKKLSQNAGKYRDREAAALALRLLQANKIPVIELPGRTADDALIHGSKKGVVATIDRELRRKVGWAIVIGSSKKLALR